MISRLQAEKTYEKYLVKLGNSARALGTNPGHIINEIIETNSKTKSERETRIPLDRTERADTEVQFIAPLRNMTLTPGSSVMINCDAVRAVGVELKYSPVYGYDNLQHVATIYHSATNTSLLIVQVSTIYHSATNTSLLILQVGNDYSSCLNHVIFMQILSLFEKLGISTSSYLKVFQHLH